jgi:hypothetical protein
MTKFQVGDKVIVILNPLNIKVYTILAIQINDKNNCYRVNDESSIWYKENYFELYNPLIHKDHKYDFQVGDKVVCIQDGANLKKNCIYIIMSICYPYIDIGEIDNKSYLGRWQKERFLLYVPEFFPGIKESNIYNHKSCSNCKHHGDPCNQYKKCGEYTLWEPIIRECNEDILTKCINSKQNNNTLVSIKAVEAYLKDKEQIKMKKVVLEIPSKDFKITYKWLEEQGACIEGKLWFVETFGYEASLDRFNDYFTEKLRNGIRHIEIDNKVLFDYSWLKWVEDRLPERKECNEEFVHIDDINNNKIYACKTGRKNIFRLIRKSSEYGWMAQNNTSIENINSISFEKDIKTAIQRTIENGFNVFEFDTFEEILKWMNEIIK